MRKAGAFLACIAAAVGGIAVALTLAGRASAFPSTCSPSENREFCHGSTSDKFAGVDVCAPGTTVYWEDSSISADAVKPGLSGLSITPKPPCTGATVSKPTIDPFPASTHDPDGKLGDVHPGKAIFRFRWTVTVPDGSKPLGTMTVAWSLSWYEPANGAGTGSTSTTSSGPCPPSGKLPPHCRYDLEVHVLGPSTFTAADAQTLKFLVTVTNNGPMRSPPIPAAAKDGLAVGNAEFRWSKGMSTVGLQGLRSDCIGPEHQQCPVPALAPGAEKTYPFEITWSASDAQQYSTPSDTGFIGSIVVIVTVDPETCHGVETTCRNNRTYLSVEGSSGRPVARPLRDDRATGGERPTRWCRRRCPRRSRAAAPAASATRARATR